jgi:predicted nucleic acid-binding protein
MHKTIISDTSCLIVLAKIGEMDLLKKVYGSVFTTQDIASEFGDSLPEWIEVLEVKDPFRQQLLELQIDKGESSAIALALEIPGSTVILDDFKARKIAIKLGIQVTGTLGVIIRARQKGILSSIKPILGKLKQTNFRLSPDLELEALKMAGE